MKMLQECIQNHCDPPCIKFHIFHVLTHAIICALNTIFMQSNIVECYIGNEITLPLICSQLLQLV